MDFLINNLLQYISAAVTTLAFAIFFKAPKKSLIHCAVIGMCGWFSYILGRVMFDVVISSLLGALCVGVLSSYASKKLFMPATIFIYTGIIPLVPGYGMYQTMNYLIIKNYSEAAIVGLNTILQAGAIAMGILVASIFSDSIARVKFDRKKDKPLFDGELPIE